MQYKDDLSKGYVNGYFVGKRQGSATQDELEPDADGYEVPHDTVRIGTVTPDALEPNFPEPKDYTVTYAKGDDAATGTAPTETDKSEGETFTVKANTLTLIGHTFASWLGSDGKTYQPDDEARMPGAAFTLTAQWEPNTYTVTFDNNDGDTEADPRTVDVDYGDTVESLPTEPTRDSYTFASWNTQADGNGDTFDTSTVVTGDITVYAKWSAA